MNHIATDPLIQALEQRYCGCRAYHGELHDHSATGGSSDGHYTLLEWMGYLQELKMDFAALVDHRQVRHMYLPDWDREYFIGGTEAAGKITDIEAEKASFHFNMIFDDPKPLEEILTHFTEMEFTGGEEGHFRYCGYTRERFLELVRMVKEKGGFFAHVHPKQVMKSEDPLHYLFDEEIGLEIFYEEMDSDSTRDNYKLWCDLLAMGKRVWATAGHDGHRVPKDWALSTVYSDEKNAAAYIQRLRVGDLTCGGMGIRMVVGDAVTGGKTDFDGQEGVFSVGDFHPSVKDSVHRYEARLISDEGEVFRIPVSPEKPSYFAFTAESERLFYRVEVHDLDRPYSLIGIGNPIWNERKLQQKGEEK